MVNFEAEAASQMLTLDEAAFRPMPKRKLNVEIISQNRAFLLPLLLTKNELVLLVWLSKLEKQARPLQASFVSMALECRPLC